METLTHTNLSYLKQLSNGSNEFILQMITLFIASMPQSISDLEKTLVEKDWPKLKFTAHKMKPGISFMGIAELEDVVTNLEELAAKGAYSDEMPTLINRIKTIIPIAITELEQQKSAFA